MRLLAALAALFMTTLGTLSAAPCSPCNWEGIYVTGLLGGGWGGIDTTFTNANYFNTLGSEIVGNDFSNQPSGFIGGGAFGYNYQCDCFVIGVEGGALYTSLRNKIRSPYFPEIDHFTAKLQWIADAKLRVGYTFNQLLAYISGGWAGGRVAYSLVDTPSSIVATSNNWAKGWTVGVGAEYKLWECLAAGLEYNYFRLQYNDKNSSCPSCGTGVGFGTPRLDSHLHAHSIMVRLSYLFSL